MPGDGNGGARRGFLIGYEGTNDEGSVRVCLVGELDSGGAELLDECRANLRAMPVSQVCFDLSALAAIDQAGAVCLIATCHGLRDEGFQVDILGVQHAVGALRQSLRTTSPAGHGLTDRQLAGADQPQPTEVPLTVVDYPPGG
jgi:anti-anti-sigma regulatory factor